MKLISCKGETKNFGPTTTAADRFATPRLVDLQACAIQLVLPQLPYCEFDLRTECEDYTTDLRKPSVHETIVSEPEGALPCLLSLFAYLMVHGPVAAVSGLVRLYSAGSIGPRLRQPWSKGCCMIGLTQATIATISQPKSHHVLPRHARSTRCYMLACNRHLGQHAHKRRQVLPWITRS